MPANRPTKPDYVNLKELYVRHRTKQALFLRTARHASVRNPDPSRREHDIDWRSVVDLTGEIRYRLMMQSLFWPALGKGGPPAMSTAIGGDNALPDDGGDGGGDAPRAYNFGLVQMV